METFVTKGVCRLSGIPTSRACGEPECADCGFNPETARRRRQAIRLYARLGILGAWGKTEPELRALKLVVESAASSESKQQDSPLG